MRPATGLTSRASLSSLVLADYTWVMETGQENTCPLIRMFTLGSKHSHSVHQGPAQTISMTVPGIVLRKNSVAARLSSVCAGMWNGKKEDSFCREFTQTGDLKDRRFSGWFPEDHSSWYKRLYCFASVLLVPGTVIRQERGSQWLEELMNCSEFFPEHLGVLLLSY